MHYAIMIKYGMLKSVEERLKSYEPLWENWTYTGNFLGEGAMSSVFEIQSTSMGLRELAALKIITVKKNFRGELKIPDNALNEIKIMQTLSGFPNIVNYHDNARREVYDENNDLCAIDILIKMEKLKALSEGIKLSEEQVVSLAKDMCNALIHASHQNIIHRDIKPQNIFWDKDNDTYKLGDFGISKIVSRFTSHHTMNVGTFAYVAPEGTTAGGGSYDISSDIYSLGLVLYVFLNNGYLPFTNTLPINEAVSKRLSGAPFPSPSNGSKNLKSLVMRACSFDKVKRFKTPEEMLEALENLSTGGKKLVVDPFATVDASECLNGDATIDYSEKPDNPIIKRAATKAPESVSAPKSTSTTGGGLRINMKTPTKAPESVSTPKSTSSTGGGLRINMKTPTNSSEDIPTPKGVSTTGGGLRINMKSTTKPSENLDLDTAPKDNLLKEPPSEIPLTNATKSSPPKPDEKKKTEKSFFSTPGSL